MKKKEMMSKLKRKIALWLFDTLLSKQDRIVAIRYNLELILEKLSKAFDSDSEMEIQVHNAMFNAKYKNSKHLNGESPLKLLESFFDGAANGKPSFLSHPFYKQIKDDGGREARRIKYLLKLRR